MQTAVYTAAINAVRARDFVFISGSFLSKKLPDSKNTPKYFWERFEKQNCRTGKTCPARCGCMFCSAGTFIAQIGNGDGVGAGVA